MAGRSLMRESGRSRSTAGIEDVAITFATRVGLLVSGIGIQSLLAYTLLPAGRGAFAVCIVFATLLGALFSPGADSGAQYIVMAGRRSLSEAVSVAVSICLVGGALAASLAVPLIQSNIEFFRKASTGSFRLALVLIPLSTVTSAMQHQLIGGRRFARLAALSLIQTAANVVALLLLVVGLDLGVDGAIGASAVSYLTMIVGCVHDLRRRGGLRWKAPSMSALSDVLRYGSRYYVARIGWALDVRVGGLVLGMIADSVAVGLFAVASGIVMRMLVVSNAISVPLLPRTARDEQGRYELVAFCARVTTWATGAALIFLVVFSEHLVRILLSAQFVPSVPLVRIMALGVLVYAGANALTEYFRGVNRPQICSWAVGMGIVTNVVLVPLLYGELGVDAAAWGLTIGLLVRSVFLRVTYCRMTGSQLRATWLPQQGDIRRFWGLARPTISRIFRRQRVVQ